MEEPSKIAEFAAVLPVDKIAVSIQGSGASSVKLEIPESELAQVMRLVGSGSEKVLRVSVSLEEPS